MLNAHLLLATMDFAAPEPPFHKQTMQHSAKALLFFLLPFKDVFSVICKTNYRFSAIFFAVRRRFDRLFGFFVCVCARRK